MSKERPNQHRVPIKEQGHRGISRRNFLIAAGALGGLFAIGGTRLAVNMLTKDRDQAPEPNGFDKDMRLIAEEVNRSGLTPNLAEQQMWQKAYQRSRQPVPVTQETLHQVGTYFNQTLKDMGNSSNKYFRHASNLIQEMNRLGPLTVSIDAFIKVGDREAFSVVHTVIKNNKLQLELNIDGQQVLNDSNGLTFALALTHEAQHIQDKVKFQESLPTSLTIEQRYQQQIQKRQSDPALDETGAYATQSESLIESFRLGVESELPEDSIHVAAMYIRTGKNKDSQAWKNYIAGRLTSKNKS